jgi:chemotaxis protein MotA
MGAAWQIAVHFMGLSWEAAKSCRLPAKSCRWNGEGGESEFMLELAARLLDPTALALVLGGTIATAAMRGTRQEVGRAAAALKPLLRGRPAADSLIARRAVREIERIVELKGIACADHVKTDSGFMRRAAIQLADAPTADWFGSWAKKELEERAARHESAISFWRAAADSAPAMGMIGTVLGLIGMFVAMDDPATIGPAMALALLTTLYGLFVSAVIATPIAARLERLSIAERRWQAAALGRLEELARAETPATTSEWLIRRARASG